MKLVSGILSLALLAMVSTSMVYAQAGDSCDSCKGGTCQGKTTVATASAVQQEEKGDCECPVSKAMQELPQLVMKVGEKTTPCETCAKEMAQESDLPIHYVVSAKTYEDKEAAYTALVKETESFVEEFVTPCTCEKSGKTKIAGESCNCPVKAGEKAQLVKTAIDGIQMSYKIGDETCNCAKTAAKKAEEMGEDLHYVVGDKTVCCPLAARLELAKQRYAAAVKAMLPEQPDS